MHIYLYQLLKISGYIYYTFTNYYRQAYPVNFKAIFFASINAHIDLWILMGIWVGKSKFYCEARQPCLKTNHVELV